MVVKASKISLRVRIQSLIQKPADHISLDMKRSCGDIHHVVQALIKFLRRSGKICDTRHIDGNNAYRACALTGAKESTTLFTELTEIQTEAAAHAADVAWLHITVDIIGKIRSTVLGSHLKEKTVVLGIRPVEFLCDGIGRDRILESTSVGISLDHGLDKCLIDHIHFFLTVFVFEIHVLAAYDSRKLCKVVWNGPVQCNVGKWCLSAPAAWSIYAIYKGLNAFLNLRIGKVVCLYKRCQISIKG